MAINVSLDGGAVRTWAGPFYAIRIGTGANNDIVISGAADGVHEHHCTLVHTGSSYRIEMLPTHLVFIDGELAECGQQLFLKNTRRCVLSIGGAPPVRGGGEIDPPPQIVCERSGEATDPAIVTIGGKPQFNRNRLRELRKALTVLAWAVIIGLPTAIGLIAWNGWQDRQDRNLITELKTVADAFPSEADVLAALPSVVQLGLDDGEGSFLPVGTGWIWRSPAGLRLVTNIHVVSQLNGPGTPSLRLHTDGQTFVYNLPEGVESARRHPNYSMFNKALARRGRDLGVPNVYDLAVLDLPDMPGVDLQGRGLELAETPPRIGQAVMMLGFPLEGDADIAVLSELATLREGRIGRVSDPFGIPAPSREIDEPGTNNTLQDGEGEYLIITGATAQGGDSGSPLIDGRGRVVAMTFASFFDLTSTDGRPDGRTQAGTVKLKALNARLLFDIPANGVAAGPVRRADWDRGLDYINADSKTSLLAQREQDTCRGRPAQRALVHSETGKDVSKAGPVSPVGTSNYARAGDIKLGASAFAGDAASHFVVVASSTASPKSVVTLKAKHPKTGQFLSSNDLASTFTAVNFSLAPEQGASSQALRYALYADQQGPVDIEVYRITCGPES